LFTIAPPRRSRRMQGLSPEHLDDPQPAGTPEGSPHHTEVPVVTPPHGETSDIPVVTPPHGETSDVPVVTTPLPQVERTDSLDDFRITNTIEDYRVRRGERPLRRLNPSEGTIVTSSEPTVGPSHGVVGQDPFWSGNYRRVLFGTESPPVYSLNPPVSPEAETPPETTTYHFILPPEMAHLTITTSVQTEVTATTLPPINTQRTSDVIPTLPPGYHALNALLNPPNPTPPHTPVGSPGGPGYEVPRFIPTLPPQFFPPGNNNPSGIIPTVAPHIQIPGGGQGGMVTFPFPRHNAATTQPTVGTQLPGGTIPTVGGPTSPFGHNIPPELAQYWTQLLQNLPQNTGGQQVVPTLASLIQG
jgi:hypothetical protein